MFRGISHKYFAYIISAGGFTYQSALNMNERKNKGKGNANDILRDLSQVISNKLQGKLDGVRFVIFDEMSMLSLRGLVEIDRRLRAAQKNEAAVVRERTHR